MSSNVKGTVEIEIKADRFKTGAQTINQQMQKINETSKKMAQSATQAGQKIDQMAQKGAASMQKLGHASNQAGAQMSRMGQASSQAAGGMSRVGQAAQNTGGSMSRLNMGTLSTVQSMGNMATGAITLEASMSSLDKAEQKVQKTTVNLGRAKDLLNMKSLALQSAEMKLEKMMREGKATSEQVALQEAKVAQKRNEHATAVSDLKVKTEDLRIAQMDQADTQKLMFTSILQTGIGTLSTIIGLISAKKSATVQDTVATKSNTTASKTNMLANSAAGKVFKSMVFDISKAKGAMQSMSVQMKAASASGHRLTGSLKAVGHGVKGLMASIGPLGWAVIGITTVWQAWEQNLFGFRDIVHDIIDAIQGVYEMIKKLFPPIQMLESALVSLGIVQKDSIDNWQELEKGERKLQKALDDGKISQDQYEKGLDALQEKTRTLTQEERELQETIADLDDQLEQNMITHDQYERQIDLITTKKEKLAKETNELTAEEKAYFESLGISTDATEELGTEIQETTGEIESMTVATNTQSQAMEVMTVKSNVLAAGLGDISERARGLTQVLDTNKTSVDTNAEAIQAAYEKVKNMDAAYAANIKAAEEWEGRYKQIVGVWGEDSKEALAFTEEMVAAINTLFDGKVPDTLPKSIKDLMKDAATDVGKSKNQIQSYLDEVRELLKKNQTLVSEWADIVKNESLDAKTRMEAVAALRETSKLNNIVDYDKLVQKRSTDLNFFNKYISSIDVSKGGWYNDPRILGDIFKHFKDKADLERAIKTSISQTGGAFQKEFAAILSRHTGQTLGGSGPTSTNFNTQTKSIYNNPNFETGGRPAGGHQTTVGSRNNKQSNLNFYNAWYKRAKAKVIKIYGYDAGPGVSGQHGRHNYFSGIARYSKWADAAEVREQQLQAAGTSTKEVIGGKVKRKIRFRRMVGYSSGRARYTSRYVYEDDHAQLAYYRSQGRKWSEMSESGQNYKNRQDAHNAQAISKFFAELAKKQRQEKHSKLTSYKDLLTSFTDLKSIGIEGGIGEVENLFKEFGDISIDKEDSSVSLITHLKALEAKRIAEQKAMQAEIRRIAAEQARIKAEQERRAKERAKDIKVAATVAKIIADPFNALDIAADDNWIRSIPNLRMLLNRDGVIDKEDERILTIAQIGQREITQRVAT